MTVTALALSDAIEQQWNLGCRSQEEIFEAVVRLHGEDAVRDLVADEWRSVLASRAQQFVRGHQHVHEEKADEVGLTREYLADMVKVPVKGGYITVKRELMTAEQQDATARWYRARGNAHLKVARQRERDAKLIRDRSVTCLAELPRELWAEAA